MSTLAVEPTRLVVATDGSCLGNPGFGGWSWAASSAQWRAGANSHTTNNLMELRAVFELLHEVPATHSLKIQIDSEYVMNTFTKWLPQWKENGWRTAARKPVANRVNLEMIAELLANRDVIWEHVRGHSGHPLNEFVDARARAAAGALKLGRPFDHGPGYIGGRVDDDR